MWAHIYANDETLVCAFEHKFCYGVKREGMLLLQNGGAICLLNFQFGSIKECK